VHNWQVQTTCYTTPNEYSWHDEDLDEESFVLQKRQNGILSIASNNIILFLYGLLTFNWAITTDFKMKTYLKKNYPTVKQRAKNTLDDFDNY
jgi:linoleoyl-CoA desaturase